MTKIYTLKGNLIFTAAVILLFAGCKFQSDDDDSNSTTTTTTTTGSTSTTTILTASSTSSRDITSDTGDIVTNTTFTNFIYLNLSTLSYSADNSSFTTMSSVAAIVTDSITVKVTDGYITVDMSGSTGATCLNMTGTLNTGTITIKSNASYAVELYLNGVSITSGNYPCIEVTKASRTFVVLNGTNSLIDGRTYGYGYGSDYASTSSNYVAAGEDTKGTLYSKGQLLFSGNGSLSVTTAYKHCIYSKEYIHVFGGTITTLNSGRNSFQCANGFIMDNGTLSITGTGTHTNNQSRGIVVEGEESDDYSGEGFILINGGTITSSTVSKGITAKWDIDEDAESTSTDDDPYPFTTITGGTISITTTGTPQDDSSSEQTFTDADGVSTSETTSLSPEGIEGKQDVYISGGTITLNTTDDGINASSSSGKVVVTGGTIYVFSSDNDAIDSNGTLTITGGTIVAVTTTTPECAFDCDSNTFTVTGGLLVGMGTANYSQPTTSVCTQNTVVMAASYAPAGGTMAVCDSSGNPVFAFTVPVLSTVASISGTNTYEVLVFSSPDISSNTIYTVYKNATVSGGSTYNGMYLAPAAMSSGTSETTFTTSSTVTTVGSISNGGAQEGPHPQH